MSSKPFLLNRPYDSRIFVEDILICVFYWIYGRDSRHVDVEKRGRQMTTSNPEVSFRDG